MTLSDLHRVSELYTYTTELLQNQQNEKQDITSQCYITHNNNTNNTTRPYTIAFKFLFQK